MEESIYFGGRFAGFRGLMSGFFSKQSQKIAASLLSENETAPFRSISSASQLVTKG